jgi:predicted nucleotidyltransferase
MRTEFTLALKTLLTGNVRFIVIGGWAAAIHGSVRVTYDLDVVYSRDRENIRNLAVCLEPYAPYLRNAPPGLPFKFDERAIRHGLNFTLTMRDLGDVDFLGEVAGGGTYGELLPFSEEIEASWLKIRCVTLERLIQLKRAAGRPKDFEAIAELQAILEQRSR